MSPEMMAAVWAAVGVLLIAAATWLTAVIQKNTAAVTAHGAVVQALTRAAGTRTEGNAPAGGGAIPARTIPLWSQLADPDPSGLLPAQRFNDCGEECAAMAIYSRHGVEVEADALRAQLGGARRAGQTTGADLVKVLARNNVAAATEAVATTGVSVVIRSEIAAGHLCIVLGRWLAPGILHWVLVTRADAAGAGANDPWGGVRRTWAWPDFEAAYAGDLVVVSRPPDPA